MRRTPEDTARFAAVHTHREALLDLAREGSGHALPKYVCDEFARYLATERVRTG